MAKVTAPNKGYTGPGPGDAVFADGVAEVEDEAALNYYRQAGYEIDGETPEVQDIEPEPVVDSREVDTVVVGTPLRDAAVDPADDDYKAPKGAGEADPHGPEVVAPGIAPKPAAKKTAAKRS